MAALSDAAKKLGLTATAGKKTASVFDDLPLSNMALAYQTTGGTANKKLDHVVNGDVSALAARVGSSGGGNEISQEGKPYGCPDGAYMTFDSYGNHICKWRSTGESFRVQPKASSGTAGVTNTTGGTGATGKYLQGPGADIFAENPVAMAADILEGRFPNTNQGLGLLEQLRPYGEAANVLFLADVGQDAAGGSKEDWLGWLENYWNTLMTPGASLGDPAQLWQNILNPAQNSPLVSYLAVQDPAQQARNFRGIAAGIAGTHLHPLIADAIMDNLNYRQDAFLGEAAKGATDPYYEFIAEQMPYIERLFGF